MGAKAGSSRWSKPAVEQQRLVLATLIKEAAMGARRVVTGQTTDGKSVVVSEQLVGGTASKQLCGTDPQIHTLFDTLTQTLADTP